MSMIYAIKHEKIDAMDIGLNTLHALNSIVGAEENVRTVFYKTFYTMLIREVVSVLTDYRHMSGFKL